MLRQISVSWGDVRSCMFLLIVWYGAALGQNYALRFYGNGIGDIDRVKIPLDNPPKAIDVGLDFTIEFQMRAVLSDNPLGAGATEGANDDWTLGHVIVDRDIFGPGDYGDYGISLAGGRIAFGVNNGINSYTIISTASVADGQWHHVAVTRSHVTGQLQIFLDGNLDKSVSTPVTGDISYRDSRTTSWPNDPYLVLGAEKHDYDNTTYPSYSGLIDELRISNVIRYVANYTPVIRHVDDSQTVGLYHFDEGTGIQVGDSAQIAGTSSHGFLQIGGTPAGPIWVPNDISGSTPLFYEPEFSAADSGLSPSFLTLGSYVSVYNAFGILILQCNADSFNISDLPHGLYLMIVRDKNGFRYRKILKTD